MTRGTTGPKAKEGRPSKYSPAYCDEAIDFLQKGYSVAALAGHLGVSRSTVYKWADENAEFSDALKAAQAKATKFWETTLIQIATGGDGNATAAIFALKNRAPDEWREKVINEHTGANGAPIEINDTDTARKLAFLLTKGVKDKG